MLKRREFVDETEALSCHNLLSKISVKGFLKKNAV